MLRRHGAARRSCSRSAPTTPAARSSACSGRASSARCGARRSSSTTACARCCTARCCRVPTSARRAARRHARRARRRATRPASIAGTTSAGRMASRDADARWTAREMQRACERYTRNLPRAAAHARRRRLADERPRAAADAARSGFDYCSDGRGTHPHLPVCNAEPIRCPQFPTTLPTLDELIGLDGIDRGERRRAPARAHARPAARRARCSRCTRSSRACAWRRHSSSCCGMESAGLEARVDARAAGHVGADGAAALRGGPGTVAGRTGTLLVQGEEFLGDVDLGQMAWQFPRKGSAPPVLSRREARSRTAGV